MFAGYSRKGDRTYARLVTSRRVDGKVVKETGDPGRVAGREGHVFRSRERGTSALDPKCGGFGPAPAGEARARLRRRMGAGPAGDLGGPVGGAGRGVAVRLRRARVPVPAPRAGPLAAQVPRGRLVGGRPGARRPPLGPPRVPARGRADGAAQGGFLDARLAWVADMADGTARVSAGPTGLPDPSRMPPAATPAHVPGRPAATLSTPPR